MIARAYRYRLYPTPEQEKLLLEVCGAVRFVYNIALEQRRDWWRQFKATTGKSISWASQSKELTALIRECDWLKASPRDVLEQALRDLDAAFAGFFRGAGYPGFRAKDWYARFRAPQAKVKVKAFNAKWGAAKLGKLPWLKFRQTREILGRVQNATVAREGNRWFISFACVLDHDVPENGKPAVGIDRGVASTLTLSTGEHFKLPELLEADARVRRLSRQMARRKRGSARRLRSKNAFAEAHLHRSAARKHWLHAVSTELARRFGTIVIEDLNVKAMTAKGRHKRGLNRSILHQGWSAFASYLAYKLEERGGRLLLVNPAYTSQTCSGCGVIDKESRESQAVFHCRHCGHRMNADENAAINILRRSTAGVEGAGCGPDEARTVDLAA